MLKLILPATDNLDELVLRMEHSLVALHNWEAIHGKAFYGPDDKTSPEMISYIREMLLDEIPDDLWMPRLTIEHYQVIQEYLNSKQTATWFREVHNQRQSGEVVTAELIYYWMIGFQIPFDCDKWHLNRLMTLIKVCGLKQTKPKKMSRAEQAEQYRQLNAARKEKLGTSG